jgi:hypothetical protein
MQCYGNCVLVKEIKSLEKNQSKDNNLQVKVKEFKLLGPTNFDLYRLHFQFSLIAA